MSLVSKEHKMKQFIRDFLSFHRGEKRGIVILLGIVIILILYLNYSYLFYPPPEKIDFTSFEKRIKSFNDSIRQETDSIDDYNQSKRQNYFHTKEEKPLGIKGERFMFNPNQLPDKDWKRLGFSEKQIKMLNNYQTKGGKFRTKADVKKMYCISDEMYKSLEPYIAIPEKKPDTVATKRFVKDTAKYIPPKREFVLVELNSADSLALTKIKGIKAFYAKKIIEHRNELGGYCRKEQLMELWKFDQEKYDGVEKQVTVDASAIKRIAINSCTAKELKHPYLTWNMVNGIINYRSKHGKFTTIEDIKKTDLVDDETYRKIVPYLKLD